MCGYSCRQAIDDVVHALLTMVPGYVSCTKVEILFDPLSWTKKGVLKVGQQPTQGDTLKFDLP